MSISRYLDLLLNTLKMKGKVEEIYSIKSSRIAVCFNHSQTASLGISCEEYSFNEILLPCAKEAILKEIL